MDMEKILDRNIKELIDTFPRIADALTQHRIGCTTCNVGTCKLRDIVEIHALSEDDEHALFSKIAAIVLPGQTVTIPRLPRKTSSSGPVKFSPPMRMLVDEHTNIKLVLAAIPHLTRAHAAVEAGTRDQVRAALDFIRNYADKFHHAKEEEILFKLFDETTDIIASMNKEHEIGRAHVRAAAAAVESGDSSAVTEHLTAYAALLTEHIRKEDEVLYPWMDRNLTVNQVGELYAKFLEVEAGFGETPGRLVAFARGLGEG